MPTTLHLDGNVPEHIERAAEILRNGGLVAFPTETVYGLGANALDPAAIAGIFAAKQRPSWDPLIVHVADLRQLPEISTINGDLAARVDALAKAFWPGPLTLLLPRTTAIPDAVTAGRPLVGVRIPQHPVALALLQAAGIPIAAPSANLFGHISPTSAAHVLADLDGRIDAVLDGGPTTIGVESTVLDPTQTPMVIYRPGAVTAEMIEAATGVQTVRFAEQPTIEAPQSLPSPGVGIRHYAPRAKLVLVSADTPGELATSNIESKERIGVLLPDGWEPPGGSIVFAWGPWDSPATLAQRLYDGLRTLDDAGVTTILAPLPPAGGLHDAIRDRMQKAARTE